MDVSHQPSPAPLIKGGIQRTLDRTMTAEQLRLLPVTVPVVLAGQAFGLSRDGVYDLLRSGTFPCRTIKVGRATKVPRAELFRVLGLADDRDRDGVA